MPISSNIMKLHQTVQKVVLEVKEVEANSAGLSYLLSPHGDAGDWTRSKFQVPMKTRKRFSKVLT